MALMSSTKARSSVARDSGFQTFSFVLTFAICKFLGAVLPGGLRVDAYLAKVRG